MKVSYNWLTEYLGNNAPTANVVAELLGRHAFEIDAVDEREHDTIIDVDVLPNRSSDCLCHRGIAREVATITGQPLAQDPLATKPNVLTTDQIEVQIADTKACPRFTAALITGVTVTESPAWLKERLQSIGQRPINNIVDATNYVMFAIGQPLHAYDATKFPQVDGTWRFGVRFANVGETMSLIAEGEKTEDRIVELQGTELLIVDESSNTPIGLAGVKGGRFAGVDETTTQVIIEAAHFDPTITRKTARRLGIVIDASKRFENEPSRELPLYAQAAVIELIKKIAEGACQGVVDVYHEPKPNPTVTVRTERVNALLGLSLSQATMVELVTQLGADVTEIPDGFTAVGPFERTDLHIEEDYIEEIGRLYGLDHITSVTPESQSVSVINTRHYYSELIRTTLIELGFSEVVTSSFRKKDKLQLKNALASDKTCLRSNLTKNITDVLDQNAGFADLFGATDTRVFEIGTVFTPGGELGVTEYVSLALGVRLKASGYSGKEDKILQDALRAVETALGTPIDWRTEKGIAETNLTELLPKLPDPTGNAPVAHAASVQYRPFSIYPHVSRDIALWVTAGTTAQQVEEVLNEHASELRVRTTLFDEFTKDSKTSYAFRLVFQSQNKTLTDSEVNKVMDSVYAAVGEQGWEVR